MATSWDVFFSYRRHDLAKAQPLLDALAEAGVREKLLCLTYNMFYLFSVYS